MLVFGLLVIVGCGDESQLENYNDSAVSVESFKALDVYLDDIVNHKNSAQNFSDFVNNKNETRVLDLINNSFEGNVIANTEYQNYQDARKDFLSSHIMSFENLKEFSKNNSDLGQIALETYLDLSKKFAELGIGSEFADYIAESRDVISSLSSKSNSEDIIQTISYLNFFEYLNESESALALHENIMQVRSGNNSKNCFLEAAIEVVAIASLLACIAAATAFPVAVACLAGIGLFLFLTLVALFVRCDHDGSPAPPSVNRCKDVVCEWNEICRNGVCIPGGRECDDEHPCGIGQICAGGTCVNP